MIREQSGKVVESQGAPRERAVQVHLEHAHLGAFLKRRRRWPKSRRSQRRLACGACSARARRKALTAEVVG